MKLTDFNIIYLTRESNQDRQKHIESILDNIGVEYAKVFSIEPELFKNQSYRVKISRHLKIPIRKLNISWLFNNDNFKRRTKVLDKHIQDVCTLLSHFKCIKLANKKNLNNLLVLEDTADILEGAENIEFEVPNDASIVYFGGLLQKVWDYPNDLKKENDFIKITPNQCKVYGTFAYALNSEKNIQFLHKSFIRIFSDKKEAYDTLRRFLIKNSRIRGQSIDLHLINYYQKQYNTYLFNPLLVAHRNIYLSDKTIHGTTFQERYYSLAKNQILQPELELKFRKINQLSDVKFD